MKTAGWKIEQGTGGGWWVQDELELRCYVCNARDSDPCGAVDGEMAECPRSIGPSGPMPDDLTPNQVFGVGGRCRRGGEHQFEPEWHGRGFDYLRCRWCGKREPV